MGKQTAGRDALGEFAPKFAEWDDSVLFGAVWSPALSCPSPPGGSIGTAPRRTAGSVI